MRGRSYTPSPPPRGYGRRGRSPAPRGGRHSSRGDGPTSLLVRNLRRDCRPEDLKRRFSQFGAVKDVYLPRDYYSGEPRGFGFIQFVEPADAADAQYRMDGQILSGREVTVVFAEENRKKPTEMRAREREAVLMIEGGPHLVIPDRPHLVIPVRPHLVAVIITLLPRDDIQGMILYLSLYCTNLSVSPREKRYSEERSYSRSPPREHEQSPPYNGTRNYSGSPVKERALVGSRSRSQSPIRQHCSPPPARGRSPSRSRSGSPPYPPAEYSRGGSRRDDRSPSQ
ncbi:serine/arginine-rich sc35-like splicing factor scl30a [Phtheirospermum japonicum]|uniref:Serine/arginine-rich sc35-like splicing factor scl30a n=1 Tax=Phtheirospermum japonicum TaxID=374723 RepID=A0A830DFP4_9LAMI|nr:serine/arginine-rich sc35-like splicing factor scl30a [Phtheirospermum japonicum]